MKAWQDLDNPLSRSALYSIWIPGIILTFQFIKYFGALDCQCTSIFRSWIGPSVYQPYSYWYDKHQALGAPYSIFWYAFYWPIAWNQWAANITLIGIDTVFLIWIWKCTEYRTTIVYESLSLLFLTMYPSDMLIFWLLIFAYKHWAFLGIAPLVKLPVGAPLWVWQWVWSSPYSIHDSENTLRYILLGSVWIGAVYKTLIKHNTFEFNQWNPLKQTRTVVARLSRLAQRRSGVTRASTITRSISARESVTSNGTVSNGKRNDSSSIQQDADQSHTVLGKVEDEPGPSDED